MWIRHSLWPTIILETSIFREFCGNSGLWNFFQDWSWTFWIFCENAGSTAQIFIHCSSMSTMSFSAASLASVGKKFREFIHFTCTNDLFWRTSSIPLNRQKFRENAGPLSPNFHTSVGKTFVNRSLLDRSTFEALLAFLFQILAHQPHFFLSF